MKRELHRKIEGITHKKFYKTFDLAMNDKATNNNFSPKILRSNQKVRQKY